MGFWGFGVFAVVDCFGDPDPDIEQAKAGDDAADGTQPQDRPELRVGREEHVLVPHVFPPRDDGDDNAEIDAEEDQDEEGDSLHPDRRRVRTRDGRRHRWRWFRRVGNELWLFGHPDGLSLPAFKVAEGKGFGRVPEGADAGARPARCENRRKCYNSLAQESGLEPNCCLKM